MCGFIAQLVEHRTGIAEVTGSNPVEALIFFQASSFQLLKLENLLRWSSLSSTTAVHIWYYFVYTSQHTWCCCAYKLQLQQTETLHLELHGKNTSTQVLPPWKHVTTTHNYTTLPKTHQDPKMLNFSKLRKNIKNIIAPNHIKWVYSMTYNQ